MRRSPTHPKPTPVVHRRARQLRRDQTDAERKLWMRLRNAQLAGLKFRRQFPIGDFIADFCCRDRWLVVELDGGQHATQVMKDARRTAILAEHGYRVVRFWDNEVLTNLEGVVDQIARVLSLELKRDAVAGRVE